MDELVGLWARLDLLVDREPGREGDPAGMFGRLRRVCSAMTGDLGACGAGLSLVGSDGYANGMSTASEPASQELEDLQHLLGEGPCFDALTSRRPVMEPDLGGSGLARWPMYAAAVQERGVNAVFAFPLQVGAARLGAVDFYRVKRGALSDRTVEHALTFTHIALKAILDGQSEVEDGLGANDIDTALSPRLEVYQAQGMVMVDLGVSLAEAMARLRGHAYAEGRTLGAVARDIVAGTLRLERDD